MDDGIDLKIAGLFAGIGGFELGLKRAGHSTELLCEIDPPAREVLVEGFTVPKSEVVEDVADLADLPAETDMVTAGFPCQDLSSTGEKNGIEGSSSSVVGQVFRLLRKRRVEWVVLENVPFMLRLKSGEAIRIITEELSTLGYRWAYRVVDTQSFGLPQRRRRVFLVASQSHDPRSILLADEVPSLPDATDKADWSMDVPVGFYWTEGTRSTGLANDSVPPLKPGSTVGIPSPPAILFPDGKAGKPDIRDAERLQGFDADWTKPAADVDRASFRWRLVGNAVSVPVAEWLGRRLRKPAEYDGDGDPEKEDEKWPDAAWSMGNGVRVADVTHYPVGPPPGGLGDFIAYDPIPLSHRATTGFLKRARKGGLRFPPGFLDALETYAAQAP